MLLTLSTLSGSTPSQPLATNDEIRADMMLSTLEIHEALWMSSHHSSQSESLLSSDEQALSAKEPPVPQTQAGSKSSASDLYERVNTIPQYQAHKVGQMIIYLPGSQVPAEK